MSLGRERPDVREWGGGPLVVGDAVVVGENWGRIRCFELASGDLRWDRPLKTTCTSGALAATAGLVIAPVWSRVEALDLATGASRWQRRGASSVSALVVDGTCFYGQEEGTLEAVRVADGRRTWRLPLRGPVRSTPAWTGRLVVLHAGGHLLAVDPARRALAWSVAGSGVPARTCPVVADGQVVAALGGRVVAVDADAGNLLWEAEMDLGSGELAVTEDRVIVRGRNGEVKALSAATGESCWHLVDPRPGPVPATGAPVVLGDVVVFSTGDSSMAAVDISDGTLLWVLPGHLAPREQIAVGPTRLVALASDGLRSASRPTTPVPSWTRSSRRRTPPGSSIST